MNRLMANIRSNDVYYQVHTKCKQAKMLPSRHLSTCMQPSRHCPLHTNIPVHCTAPIECPPVLFLTSDDLHLWPFDLFSTGPSRTTCSGAGWSILAWPFWRTK